MAVFVARCPPAGAFEAWLATLLEHNPVLRADGVVLIVAGDLGSSVRRDGLLPSIGDQSFAFPHHATEAMPAPDIPVFADVLLDGELEAELQVRVGVRSWRHRSQQLIEPIAHDAESTNRRSKERAKHQKL